MARSAFSQPQVTVWGLRSLDGALKSLAPDLRRKLYKEMGGTLKKVAGAMQMNATVLGTLTTTDTNRRSPIATNASAIVDGIKVKRGAKSRKSRATAFGFRIEQSHGYGVMAEFAKTHTNASGKALIDALNRRSATPGGRFMWATMDDQRPYVEDRVRTAVETISNELQRRVDAMTIGTP